MKRKQIATAWLCFLIFWPLWAGEYELVPGQTIFAVVTHKGGLLKGLAHDHFVFASAYESRLQLDPQNTEDWTIELDFPVARLVIDDPLAAQVWFGKLKDLDIQQEPFTKQEPDQRKKISKAMLSKKQLNGDEHPHIRAKLAGVAPKQQRIGTKDFSHELSMEITIRDKTVKKAFAAEFTFLEDGSLTLEAVATCRFTEFGIEPFSAAFGSIANKDEFNIYVALGALAKQEP